LPKDGAEKNTLLESLLKARDSKADEMLADGESEDSGLL